MRQFKERKEQSSWGMMKLVGEGERMDFGIGFQERSQKLTIGGEEI